MSVGSTSNNAVISDGRNTAEVSSKRRLQVTEPDLQTLIAIGNEQLRQLTKIALILSAMSGVSVDDSELDTPTF